MNGWMDGWMRKEGRVQGLGFNTCNFFSRNKTKDNKFRIDKTFIIVDFNEGKS